MNETLKVKKSQKIKITKPGDNLDRIMCGYKWQEKPGPTWDIDGSIIIQGAKGEYIDTVYYGHRDFGHYIHHNGDNLTGAGRPDSDKEQIDICLKSLPANVERLVVIMNIFQAYSKKQDLTGISNCSMHIQNCATGKDLVEFDISGKDTSIYRGKTGFYIGNFYRNGSEWEFEAVGEAIRVKDIEAMQNIACKYYQKKRTKSFSEYIRSFSKWEEREIFLRISEGILDILEEILD